MATSFLIASASATHAPVIDVTDDVPLTLNLGERKALAKRLEEERKAEIRKYDLNGDGKLDEHENKLRIEDQERKRKAQKKSKESQELSKPMIEYLGK